MPMAIVLAVAIIVAVPVRSGAQELAQIHNVNVTTDVGWDFTSTDALLARAIQPGMTDEEKCTAMWELVYLPRFWNPSTRGGLRDELGGADPILQVNSFAPTICQEDSEQLIALWSLLGYSTRMWQLGWHTPPEVWYGGRWRHFDPTLGVITRDQFGEIDSVANRTDYWRPEYWGTSCPWMGPSAYVSHSEQYLLGHTMGLTMRRGESLTRYWYPLSSDADYYSPGNNGQRPRDRGPGDGYSETYLEKAMALTTWRFEILPYDAAYANGVWQFTPDFRDANWQALLAGSENLAASDDGGNPYIHPAAPGQQGEAVFRIKSPYVLTGGWITATVTCDTAGDEVRVLVSNDLGNTWQQLWSKNTIGQQQPSIALLGAINSKFDCLVKITMLTNSQPTSVKVKNLQFEVIAQNNPFALSSLKLGQTQVTVSAGEQLERLSIVPPLDSPDYRNYIASESNIVTAREAGQSSWVHGICAAVAGQESYLIFRVTSPADMTRVRWGGRFEEDNDDNKLYYSFDGVNWLEKPWTYQQTVKPTQNSVRARIADYETLDTLPPGTREIWLKYWFYRSPGESGSSLQLMTGLRIDVDYAPAETGPLPPVEVIYCWAEHQGPTETERTHTQQISSYPFSYNITVAGDSEPTMKWVKVSRPGSPFPQPVVDAGPDQIITLPDDTADLAGTVTDDGLPDPPGAVTTTWSVYSGPGSVQFGDSGALQTTATFGQIGTYVLRLTADDGQYQGHDDVTVTVGYVDVATGLFSRYSFDIDARDDAGSNDGSLDSGATIVSDGERGNVLSLDGLDDHVTLPAGNMAAGRSELTLTMWVNPDQWTSSNVVYDECGGDWGEYWQFSILGGAWCTRDASTGSMGSRDNDLAMPSVPAGQWHHLAFVYSVSQGVKAIYYDGALYNSTTTSIDTLTTGRAAARVGFPADGNYYDGLIDEMRFYNRALSAVEIGLLAENTYTLTVNSGNGDGDYTVGSVVEIDAAPAPSGQQFGAWTGDAAGVGDTGAASTTIIMPPADAEVTATYVDILAGDLDGDGIVSGPDLDIILVEWGRTGTEIIHPRADITGDGLVSGADLDIVLADWGRQQ